MTSEAPWPTWNPTSIDSFVQSVSVIHQQIDYLFNRQQLIERKNKDELNNILSSIQELKDASLSNALLLNQSNQNRVEKEEGEKEENNTNSSTNNNSGTNNEKLLADFTLLTKDLRDEISKLKNEIDYLKNNNLNMERNFDKKIENQINYLDNQINNKFQLNDKKFNEFLINYEDDMKEMKEMKSYVDDKVSLLMRENENLKNDYENKIKLLENNIKNQKIDTDKEILNLKDSLNLKEIQLKKHEKDYQNLLNDFNELKSTKINDISEKIEDLFNKLNLLEDNQSNLITQINSRFSSLGIENKVDRDELNELYNTTNELQRRITLLMTDTSDRLTSLDSKLDRRSDRIVAYCLKQLRKELKGHLQTADNDNTDIGKIRCLVCDQVTSQKIETGIVHSNNPALPVTMKPYRRQGSPPNSRPTSSYHKENDNNVYNTTTNSNGSPTKPSNAIPSTRNTRIVKPSANNPQINGYDSNDNDFNYIASNDLIQSLNQQTESAPMIQIISHHPVDATHVRLPPNTLPPNLRDLDQ